VVLCVAGEHRAIEVVAGETCHSIGGSRPVTSGELSGAVPTVGDGCAEGCSDTTLASGPLIGAAKNKKATDLHEIASPSLVFADPCERQLDRHSFDFTRFDSPFALRTIVLRC
jgi:hypothetical protein